MNQYGHGKGTTQGGFSEYSVVKSKYCYVLKTDISFDDAVLLEPMGKLSKKSSKKNILDRVFQELHSMASTESIHLEKRY